MERVSKFQSSSPDVLKGAIHFIEAAIELLHLNGVDIRELESVQHVLQKKISEDPNTNGIAARLHLPAKISVSSRGEECARSEMTRFTERELIILQLLYGGFTNAEIAKQVGVKPRTAKGYVSRLLARFDASNRTELIGCALDMGVLHPRKGFD